MAENEILTIQVTKGQVFPSKNPDVMMVSIRDDASPNKFSTFPVAADKITGDGQLRQVSLEKDRDYDISKPAAPAPDGKKSYEHQKVTGGQIYEMYQTAKQKAMEDKKAKDGPQQEAPQADVPKNAYMNRVSTKMIHDTNLDHVKRVSVRDQRSSDGLASFLVPAANIFMSKDKSGKPIPERMNINLGPETSSMKYSIRGQDGKFQPVAMTASDVATLYRDEQKAYMSRQRQAVKETPEPQAAAEEPALGFDDEMAIE